MTVGVIVRLSTGRAFDPQAIDPVWRPNARPYAGRESARLELIFRLQVPWRVLRVRPVVVRALLRPLAIEARPVFTGRRLDARRLHQPGEKFLTALARVTPDRHAPRSRPAPCDARPSHPRHATFRSATAHARPAEKRTR